MNKKNRIIVLMILVLFSFLTLFFVKDKKDQKQEVVIREKVALQEHESKIEDNIAGHEHFFKGRYRSLLLHYCASQALYLSQCACLLPADSERNGKVR